MMSNNILLRKVDLTTLCSIGMYVDGYNLAILAFEYLPNIVI